MDSFRENTLTVNNNKFEVIKQIITQTYTIKYLELSYTSENNLPSNLIFLGFSNQTLLEEYRSFLKKVPQRVMAKELLSLSNQRSLYFDFNIEKTLSLVFPRQLEEEKLVILAHDLLKKILKLNNAGIYLKNLDLDEISINSSNFLNKKSRIIDRPSLRFMIKPFQFSIFETLNNISSLQLLKKIKQEQKQKEIFSHLFYQIATGNQLDNSLNNEGLLIKSQIELTSAGYNSEFTRLILEIIQSENPILENLEDVKTLLKSFKNSKNSLLIDSVKLHQISKVKENKKLAIKVPCKIFRISSNLMSFKIYFPEKVDFLKAINLKRLNKSIDPKYSKDENPKSLYDTVKTDRNSLAPKESPLLTENSVSYMNLPMKNLESLASSNIFMNSGVFLQREKYAEKSFKSNIEDSTTHINSSRFISNNTQRSNYFSRSAEKSQLSIKDRSMRSQKKEEEKVAEKRKSLEKVKNSEKNLEQVCGICGKGKELFKLQCLHYYHKKCFKDNSASSDENLCPLCFAPVNLESE